MNKTILAAVAATTMLSGVANATLVSNGGQPSISLSEIQANLDAGTYTQYPGVIRDVNGIRVGPSGGGYLFAKTFKPGMALPVINDIVALQKALAKKDETILVASNEWILPIPAVFVELARQNGVDASTFMGHYLEATADISQDDFASYAAAQTQAVISALGIDAVTVNTQVLVQTGLTEAQAQAIADAAASLATERAQVVIDRLDAENMQLVMNIMEANRLKSEVQGLLDIANGKLTDVTTAVGNAYFERLPAGWTEFTLAEKVQEIVTNYNSYRADNVLVSDIAEALNTDRAGIFGALNGLSNSVNTLTTERDNLAASISEAKSISLGAANSNVHGIWNNSVVTTSTSLSDDFVSFSQEIGRLRGIIGDLRATPAFSFTYANVAAAKADANSAYDATSRKVGTVEGGFTANPNTTDNPSYSLDGITTGTDGWGDPAPFSNAGITSAIDNLSTADLISSIREGVEASYHAGYNDGYDDGYADGYADGFADGSATN